MDIQKDSSLNQGHQFPEHIIDKILFRLPVRDGCRTSILSKGWGDAWSTRSSLIFDESQYNIKADSLEEKRDLCQMFNEDVSKNLGRVERIERFILVKCLCLSSSDKELVDQWIHFVAERKVEELVVHICNKLGHGWYLFPEVSNHITLSLKRLSLSGIELPPLYYQLVFKVLEDLSLFDCCTDEKSLNSLIESCPQMKSLKLSNCHGLNSLQLKSLPRLVKVLIHHVRMIDIRCSSVQTLYYSGQNIQLEDYNNVYKLGLTSTFMSCSLLSSLIMKMPLLTCLQLVNCKMMKRIEFCSNSLRRLTLGFLANGAHICIEAPLLEVYKCCGQKDILDYDIRSESLKRVSLTVSILSVSNIWSDFNRIGDYLSKFNHEVFLSLSLDVFFDTVEDLVKPTGTPYGIDRFDITLNALKKTEPVRLVETLLNGLLWTCHPRELSIILPHWIDKNEIVKFIREKLIPRVQNQEAAHKCSIRGMEEVGEAERGVQKVKHSKSQRLALDLTWGWPSISYR